jgi:TRAP-type C4-dicarboxylate transport system permease small subunit
MIQNLLDRLCRVLSFVMVIFLAAMVVMVFGNVVLRYAFNSGITVSEELSRWLFVWMTFLGALVALRTHHHLGTDSLVARLPVAGKKICLGASHLLMLYLCWLMFQGPGSRPSSTGHHQRRDGSLDGLLLRAGSSSPCSPSSSS